MMDDVEQPNLIAALPGILWQRRWIVIAVTLLTTIAGVAAALLLPPLYRSSATVLIESSQLAADPNGGTLTDVIDQRLARARERVLSRADLIRLIRSNDLYPREQRTTALSKIVEKMKDATTIASASGDGPPGRAGSTISLTIAFDYSDPVKAQVVAQQYVNRFLEVDAGAQAEQATGAAGTLQDQADSLQSQIARIEGQITAIKTRNGTLLTLGQQTTGDPIADSARIDSDISRLEADNARLAAAARAPAQDSGVAAAEAALRSAQARFSDTHPDVIAAKAQLDAARRTASAYPAGNASAGEMAANRAQILALRGAKGMLLSQSASARAAAAKAPAIASQVDGLDKQADALRDQYRTIAARLQSAQLAARMQTEQKGERLALVDPPVVPDRPTKPNRPAIIVASILAGLGIAFGIVMGLEFLLKPIRGTASVVAATGQPPLVVIPDLARKHGWFKRLVERRHRRKLARV